MINLKNLITKCRSYRRFYQDYEINKNTLKYLVDLARCSASAVNLQPLKYVLSYQPKTNNLIFSTLRWAGYLKDWSHPEEGERPSAYIIILADRNLSKWCDYDCAIAAQTILLGAVDKGLGGCMFGSVDRDLLRKNLPIPKEYDIPLVVALGKPKEQVVIDEVKSGDTKYYRDNKSIHHVPKKALKEIIIELND